MALLCLWCGYSLNWIKQRRDTIAVSGAMEISSGPYRNTTAPGLLFLFGEAGYDTLGIGGEPTESISTTRDLNHCSRKQSLL